METKNELTKEQCEQVLIILKTRFEQNPSRHKNLEWDAIQKKLKTRRDKLWSLFQMESTGGEPDIIEYDHKADEYVFYDCSVESPKGRRSICYDKEALESRKENKPTNTAVDMATFMGVDILTEKEYRELQKIGNFDTKTSSWVKTPTEIRKLGGALFCDRRYDTVFVYHNGAESYYGVRGFRSLLRV